MGAAGHQARSYRLSEVLFSVIYDEQSRPLIARHVFFSTRLFVRFMFSVLTVTLSSTAPMATTKLDSSLPFSFFSNQRNFDSFAVSKNCFLVFASMVQQLALILTGVRNHAMFGLVSYISPSFILVHDTPICSQQGMGRIVLMGSSSWLTMMMLLSIGIP
jgi:hypothetical protein